jgi:hypothetical protein
LGRGGPAHRDRRYSRPARAPLLRVPRLGLRHPPEAWPLFEKYLRAAEAHHAFVAVAVEAARYYPGRAPLLLGCSSDSRRPAAAPLPRPRLLESLYVWATQGRSHCSRSCWSPGTPTPTWTTAR